MFWLWIIRSVIDKYCIYLNKTQKFHWLQQNENTFKRCDKHHCIHLFWVKLSSKNFNLFYHLQMRFKLIIICINKPVSVPKYQNQSKHKFLKIIWLTHIHRWITLSSDLDLTDLTQHFLLLLLFFLLIKWHTEKKKQPVDIIYVYARNVYTVECEIDICF